MAKGRKIEGALEARRCLSAVASSGATPREWAHKHGIDARSLNMWRVIFARNSPTTMRRRRAPTTAVARKGLVELVPPSHARATTTGTNWTPARYVLEVDGARLEFGDDVSAATLRRVLEALRSC